MPLHGDTDDRQVTCVEAALVLGHSSIGRTQVPPSPQVVVVVLVERAHVAFPMLHGDGSEQYNDRGFAISAVVTVTV
jgi:hypothetical protein